MNKTVSLIIVVSIITLFLTADVIAITASMGNARMVLYPEIDGKNPTTIEKSILVKNVNDVPIKVKLVSGEDATFISIIDEELELQPGDEVKAKFEITVDKLERYEGKINVVFEPLDKERPGVDKSGVVLASNIIVIPKLPDGTEAEDNGESVFVILTSWKNIINNPIKLPSIVSEGGSLGKSILFVASGVLVIILFMMMYYYYNKGKNGIKDSKVNKNSKEEKLK